MQSQTPTQLLADLKTGLEEIYGPRLRRLYLYGSYARGEARPDSDVDILIVLDNIGSYAAEIERTADIVSSVSLDYGLSVSRVFVSEHNWETQDSGFLANVREEAVAA